MTAIQYFTRKRVATRLPYIDSIRGIAALYVAIGHIWQFLAFQPPYANLPKIFTLLNFGHAAVGSRLGSRAYLDERAEPLFRRVDRLSSAADAQFDPLTVDD